MESIVLPDREGHVLYEDCVSFFACVNSAIATGSQEPLIRLHDRLTAEWLPKLQEAQLLFSAEKKQVQSSTKAYDLVQSKEASSDSFAHRVIVRTLLSLLKSQARKDPEIHTTIVGLLEELGESFNSDGGSGITSDLSRLCVNEFGDYLLSSLVSSSPESWNAGMKAVLSLALLNESDQLSIKILLHLLSLTPEQKQVLHSDVLELVQRWTDKISAVIAKTPLTVRPSSKELPLLVPEPDWNSLTSIAVCKEFVFLSGDGGVKKIALRLGTSTERTFYLAAETKNEVLHRSKLVCLQSGILIAVPKSGDIAYFLDPETLAILGEEPMQKSTNALVTSDGRFLYTFTETTNTDGPSDCMLCKYDVSQRTDQIPFFTKTDSFCIVLPEGVDHVTALWTNGTVLVVQNQNTLHCCELSNGHFFYKSSEPYGQTVAYDWQTGSTWAATLDAKTVKLSHAVHPRLLSHPVPFAMPFTPEKLTEFIVNTIEVHSAQISERVLMGLPIETEKDAPDLAVNLKNAAKLLQKTKDEGISRAVLQYCLVSISQSPAKEGIHLSGLETVCSAFLECASNSVLRKLSLACLGALSIFLPVSVKVSQMESVFKLASSGVDCGQFFDTTSRLCGSLLATSSEKFLSPLFPVICSSLVAKGEILLKVGGNAKHEPMVEFVCSLMASLRQMPLTAIISESLLSFISELAKGLLYLFTMASSLENPHLAILGASFEPIVSLFTEAATLISNISSTRVTELIELLSEVATVTGTLAEKVVDEKRSRIGSVFFETPHPLPVPWKKSWTWDFSSYTQQDPITFEFAPESESNCCTLILQTDKDKTVLEDSYPSKPCLRLQGSKLTARFTTQSYSDSDKFGFKCTVKFLAYETSNWLSKFHESVVQTMISFLSKAVSPSQVFSRALETWVKSKLFEKGTSTGPLSESGKLLLSSVGDELHPGLAKLTAGLCSNTGDHVKGTTLQVATAIAAAFLHHKNMAETALRSVESPSGLNVLADYWKKAVVLARDIVESNKSTPSEAIAKCKLLLSLHPASLEVKRSITQSMSEMKQKFTAPKRGVDALRKLSVWRDSIKSQSSTASFDVLEKISEFVVDETAIASVISDYLRTNLENCSKKISLFYGICGLLKPLAGRTPRVDFGQLALIIGEADIFKNCEGIPASEMEKLRTSFFHFLGTISELLTTTVNEKNIGSQSLTLKNQFCMLKIWNTALGTGNEDFVAKSGVVSVILDTLALHSSGDGSESIRVFAFQTLLKLVMYCFKESGGDTNAPTEASCRGYIVHAICAKLSEWVEDPKLVIPAPAVATSSSEVPQIRLHSGLFCSLVLSLLLILGQQYKSAQVEIVNQIHTTVLLRLLAKKWGAHNPQILILRLLKMVLPLRTPSKIKVPLSQKKMPVLDFLFEQISHTLAPRVGTIPDPESGVIIGSQGVAMEAVLLFRFLMHCDEWKQLVSDKLKESLDAAPEVLELLKKNDLALLMPKFASINAALTILGGVDDIPRVGGKVHVIREKTPFSGLTVDIVSELSSAIFPLFGVLPRQKLEKPPLFVDNSDYFLSAEDVVAVNEVPIVPPLFSLGAFVSNILQLPAMTPMCTGDLLEDSQATDPQQGGRLLYSILRFKAMKVATKFLPFISKDLSSANLLPALQSITNTGMVPYIPSPVVEIGSRIFEWRVGVATAGLPQLNVAVGSDILHCDTVGSTLVKILPEGSFTGALTPLDLILLGKAYLNYSISGDNRSSSSASDWRDRSTSWASASSDSSNDSFSGSSSSSASSEMSEEYSDDSRSYSSSRSRSRSRSPSGSDSGADSADDYDDDSETPRHERTPRRRKPQNKEAKNSDKKVFQTKELGKIRGRAVIITLSKSHTTVKYIQSKYDDVVSAGATAVLMAVDTRTLSVIFDEMRAPATPFIVKSNVPIILLPKQFALFICQELRKRQALHTWSEKMPDSLDNVLASTFTGLTSSNIRVRLGEKRNNGALPERIMFHETTTALPEIKNTSPVFEATVEKVYVKSSMYLQDEEDGTGIFHEFLWKNAENAHLKSLKRLYTDQMSTPGIFPGAACFFESLADFLRQQVMLGIMDTSPQIFAGFASQHYCVAQFFHGILTRTSPDDSSIHDMHRKHMFWHTCVPPYAPKVAEVIAKLKEASPLPSSAFPPQQTGASSSASPSPAPKTKPQKEDQKKAGFFSRFKSKVLGTIDCSASAENSFKRHALINILESLEGVDKDRSIGALYLARYTLLGSLEKLSAAEINHLHFSTLCALFKTSSTWLKHNSCQFLVDLFRELVEKKLSGRIERQALIGYKSLYSMLNAHLGGALFSSLCELYVAAREYCPDVEPASLRNDLPLTKLFKLSTLVDVVRHPLAQDATEVPKPIQDIISDDGCGWWSASPVCCESLRAFSAEVDQQIYKYYIKNNSVEREPKIPADIEDRFFQGISQDTRCDRATFLHVLSSFLTDNCQYIDIYGASWRPLCLASRIASIKTHISWEIKKELVSSLKSHLGNHYNSDADSLGSYKVNRVLAEKALEAGRITETVFGQIAFKLLRGADRMHVSITQPFDITFLGEGGYDAGGLFRDCLSHMARELQSGNHLFIQCPNGKFNKGDNREKFVPKPSATDETSLLLYEFVGILFGITIHSSTTLALNLPSLLWKTLICEKLELSDLYAIDASAMCIDSIRTMTQSPEADEMLTDFTFTVLLSDGKEIELKPGGADIPVTWDTRLEFCNLMEQKLLHSYDKQLAAIRRGLEKTIPIDWFRSFLSWKDLELAVCAEAKLDVDRLKEITSYSGCRASDDHIKFLWEVVAEMTPDLQSKFLRFVTGTERMPATGDFPFHIEMRSGDDSRLPESGTCGRRLELPRYSSKEITREKLLYAILHCTTLDGDNASAPATVYDDLA